MSAQHYSVTVQCDFCDEVISLSGRERNDSNVAILRNKMHGLGWKTSNIREAGEYRTMDCCPICKNEHLKV